MKLTTDFFARNTLIVAKELIGKKLVSIDKSTGAKTELIINETEAYVGPHDLACHASKGRTKRTEVLFGEAGTIYMYLIYGIYWMLNVVTEKTDYPAAVLIRGAGKWDGPGKLTRELGLTGELNNLPLGSSSGLWFEKGITVVESEIITTPRIGVDYAGPDWSQRPYRFVYSGDK